MASTNDVWSDFDVSFFSPLATLHALIESPKTIRHNIKQNTVDKLKQILSGLNEQCGTNFSKSGKKQEIIDRIVVTLDHWRTGTMTEKWIKAKAVFAQVRYSGM
jgi:E3 SUMO-protein ligase PIAS1